MDYFKCPTCNEQLFFEDMDSDLWGAGRHFCQVCQKPVLPLELRKVPRDQRIAFAQNKSPPKNYKKL